MRSLSIAVLGAALFVSSPVVAQSDQPEGEKPPTEGTTLPEALPMAPPPPVLPAEAEPVRYAVTITGRAGTKVSIDGDACSVPCQVSVVPGPHEVEVSGPFSLVQRFAFPAARTTLTVEYQRTRLRAFGIAGVAVGLPIAVLGIYALHYFQVEQPKHDPCLHTSGMECHNTGFFFDSFLIGSLGILGVTNGVIIATIVGGVGFGLMGKDRLVLRGPRQATSDDEPPLRLVGLAAAPVRGGAMLGATFVF